MRRMNCSFLQILRVEKFCAVDVVVKIQAFVRLMEHLAGL